MLKYINPRAVIFTFILFMLTFSCNKKNESINNYTTKQLEIEPNISFKKVVTLNDVNKKVLEIAFIAFNNSKELRESQILLKIKNEHQKIELELKKITAKNLIIIPESIFDLKLDHIFLKEINSNKHLLSLLEKEISNQINLFDSIGKTTKDREFKRFAVKYKDILIENNKNLSKFL